MRTTDTRERLLDAALSLFADQGYARTSVGQIEAAAGLMPRSGGMYRHFPSKEALLLAAVERELASAEGLALQLGVGVGSSSGAPGESRSPRQRLTAGVDTAFGMTRSRLRLRRIFSANEPLLAEPARRYREIVEQSQATAAEAFADIASQFGRKVDTEALAVITAAALNKYHEDQATPFKVLLGVDEERFLKALVEYQLATLGVQDEPAGG